MAKKAKTKKWVSENVLSACLATSENTTLKLQEELTELKDQTTPHLSTQEGICHLYFFLYNEYTTYDYKFYFYIPTGRQYTPKMRTLVYSLLSGYTTSSRMKEVIQNIVSREWKFVMRISHPIQPLRGCNWN